jgi:predicted regulator of Ras-like GTPase activity (Roadblock/LC7/MglB family)
MGNTTLHNSPLVFDSEQMQEINRILLWLADQIGAPLVMVTDVSGRLLLYRGRLSSSQSSGLAALAAGSFAAGVEIGNFLGLQEDNGFNHQLLEGRLANLYTLTIGNDLLLVIAFTEKATLGMVRLFSQQAQANLLELANAAHITREQNKAFGIRKPAEGFNEELTNQLDELFAEGI